MGGGGKRRPMLRGAAAPHGAGLGSRDPVTNDYVPVFPWFGPVLIGLAIGRTVLRRRTAPSVARWRAESSAAQLLAWAGRKSLLIYLIHQPVLLAALMGVLQFAGPHPEAQARAFLQQCTAECLGTGSAGFSGDVRLRCGSSSGERRLPPRGLGGS